MLWTASAFPTKPEQGDRATLQLIGLAAPEGAQVEPAIGRAGIHECLPPHPPAVGWQDETDRLVMGVEEEQERVVSDRIPSGIHIVDGIS